jgi:uncharacterized RDD family membrane protein YckC
MPGKHYNAHETERMRELHGAELASFWRRAIAFVIDFALAGLLFLLLFVGILYLSGGTPHLRVSVAQPGGESPNNYRLTFFGNWWSLVWLTLYFGLATYIGRGKTPGKWLLGIRVVSLVHERLGFWHAVERALGYGASALEFGFGFVQYFIHPNRRTVHDRIAETIVVSDSPPRGVRAGVAAKGARDEEMERRNTERAPASSSSAAFSSKSESGT